MVAKIIAFTNQKGGVGKTTLAVMTACWLAQHDRKKVLVVDMDAQGSASSFFVGRDNLKGTKSDDLFNETISDLTVQKVELEEPYPIYFKKFFQTPELQAKASIDLIGSGSVDGSGYDTESLPIDQISNPAVHLRRLAKDYDYIVLDCPPSLGRRLLATIIASDYVICPMKLSGSALEGLQLLMFTIANMKQNFNPNLEIAGFVINEFRPIASNKMTLEELQNSPLRQTLFETCIRHNAPTDMAMTKGSPLWCTASAFRAIEQFAALMDEIQQRTNH